ncbi:MAG: rhamnogalacturonan acetylesterase [Bacteroidota bacterium]|nr:rhamnogalacturonan acetylesterase [Bacteroidota bacterium]
MKKSLLISLGLGLMLNVSAQQIGVLKKFTFGNGNQKNAIKIDSTTKYTETNVYGLTTFGKMTVDKRFIASEKPFFFSVQLPEGHYRVTLTLGGNPEGSSTTLKAESRRLMFENLKTKAGKTVTKTIVVDLRTPQVDDSTKIKLKPRELNFNNWDNKLTLEFAGEKPCISAIEIQKADKLPTIFLAGNSTVTDQEYEPWASWGQMFTCFLKPNVVVANFAESGETLLAFKRENRLKKILSLMKKGDYLFMEFAHNDQKPGWNHLDAFTTYKAELKYYISEAKKKGGISVLVTSTNRRRFDENGKIINTLEDFPAAMRQLATEENVMLVDLNAMSKDLYEALGPETSKKAFVHYPANSYPGQTQAFADDTHFNPYGAYELAKCVIQSIVTNNYPMKQFVNDNWKTFNPKQPDSLTDFHWYESPWVDVLKPDGN